MIDWAISCKVNRMIFFTFILLSTILATQNYPINAEEIPSVRELIVSPNREMIAAVLQTDIKLKESFAYELWVYTISNHSWRKLTLSARIGEVSWAPDSTEICFRRITGNKTNPIFAICVVDIKEGNVRVLTDQGVNSYPSWCPYGNQIAFSSWKGNNQHKHLWLINSDGTGEHPLTDPGDLAFWCGWTWASDGSKIFYSPANTNAIWEIEPVNGRKKKVGDGFKLGPPVCSSNNGKMLFFENCNDLGGFWMISVDGRSKRNLFSGEEFITSIAWSPDDTKIAFYKGTGKEGTNYYVWVMAVDGKMKMKLSSKGMPQPYHHVDWISDEDIVFSNGKNIWITNIDGSNQRQIYPEYQ